MQRMDVKAKTEQFVVGDDALNKLEITSIRALIAYTAHEHGVAVEVVTSIVTTHLGVNNITQVRQHRYDDTIRYLVDMKPKECIN